MLSNAEKALGLHYTSFGILMTDYKWTPIAPLSDAERAIDIAAMRPLYESWRASKRRLASADVVDHRSAIAASCTSDTSAVGSRAEALRGSA